MSFTVDFSSIRTVRVHKEQFDAIDNKANVVMILALRTEELFHLIELIAKKIKSID